MAETLFENLDCVAEIENRSLQFYIHHDPAPQHLDPPMEPSTHYNPSGGSCRGGVVVEGVALQMSGEISNESMKRYPILFYIQAF